MNKNSSDSSDDLKKFLNFNSEYSVEELLPELVQLNFNDTALVRKAITSLGYTVVTYYCGHNYLQLNRVLDWFDKLAVNQSTDMLYYIQYVCFDKANFLIEEGDQQYAYSLLNIVINNSRANGLSQRILNPLNLTEKTEYAYQLIEWSIQFSENIEGDDENFYATGILEKTISFAENNVDPSKEDGIYFDRFWMMQARVAWPNSTFENVYNLLEPICTPKNQIDKFPETEYEQTLIILKKLVERSSNSPTRKHQMTLLNRTLGLAMTRRVLNFPHQSIEMLISHLKLLKIKAMNGFILFLSKIKYAGKVSYEKVQSYFYEYIQLLLKDKKQTQTVRCDSMKWYLDVFRMTPNSVIKKDEFEGYTILMLACQSEANLAILTMFVEHLEGNVNLIAETTYSGIITPLSVACENNNLAAVKYLIAHEADPNGSDICCPALHLCLPGKNTTITDFLLDQSNVDVNKIYSNKYPIHLAAKYTDVRTVMKLVNRGASPDQESSLGETPLHLALMSQKDVKYSIVRYLLLICKVRKNLLLKGESPLFIAARTGQSLAVETLLTNEEYTDPVVESGCYKGHTPLTIAIQECHETTVAMLLQQYKLDATRLVKPPKMKKPQSVFQFAQACARIDKNKGRKNIIAMLAALDHAAVKSNNASIVITKEIFEEKIEVVTKPKMNDNDKVGKIPKKHITSHPPRVSVKQVKTEEIKAKLAMNKQARAEKSSKPVKSPTTVANHPNGLLTHKELKPAISPEPPDHEDVQWPEYEDNWPLHKITRAVEQTIFDIDRCPLNELNSHLSILADFLLPIQEVQKQGLLTPNSPIVTQIEILHEEIKIRQEKLFSHTELLNWKNAILTAYQEIIDQFDWMFHLDNPELRKLKNIT